MFELRQPALNSLVLVRQQLCRQFNFVSLFFYVSISTVLLIVYFGSSWLGLCVSLALRLGFFCLVLDLALALALTPRFNLTVFVSG